MPYLKCTVPSSQFCVKLVHAVGPELLVNWGNHAFWTYISRVSAGGFIVELHACRRQTINSPQWHGHSSRHCHSADKGTWKYLISFCLDMWSTKIFIIVLFSPNLETHNYYEKVTSNKKNFFYTTIGWTTWNTTNQWRRKNRLPKHENSLFGSSPCIFRYKLYNFCWKKIVVLHM